MSRSGLGGYSKGIPRTAVSIPASWKWHTRYLKLWPRRIPPFEGPPRTPRPVPGCAFSRPPDAPYSPRLWVFGVVAGQRVYSAYRGWGWVGGAVGGPAKTRACDISASAFAFDFTLLCLADSNRGVSILPAHQNHLGNLWKIPILEEVLIIEGSANPRSATSLQLRTPALPWDRSRNCPQAESRDKHMTHIGCFPSLGIRCPEGMPKTVASYILSKTIVIHSNGNSRMNCSIVARI